MTVSAVKSAARSASTASKLSPPTATLREGARGAAVQQLQRCLVKLGYLKAADYKTGPGAFGPHTEAALKSFQAHHGCAVDGWYGDQSEKAMRKALGTAGATPSKPPTSGSSASPVKEPAGNYQRITWRGVTVNQRTKEMVLRAESYAKKMGVPTPIRFSQGSYHKGFGPSAGTHDGGGALDIRSAALSRPTELKLVKALRMAGFAAWSRGHNGDGMPPHIHALAIGDKQMSASARSQVKEYFWGGDGLVGSRSDGDRAIGRPFPDWAKKYK
ncbi:MAG TPA: peptidoglycan-binding domain-containing protein [Myxococcales bacterium]|jgi:peptidoglycan hydrolase-like protein with peptidoglycan-binding domain